MHKTVAITSEHTMKHINKELQCQSRLISKRDCDNFKNHLIWTIQSFCTYLLGLRSIKILNNFRRCSSQPPPVLLPACKIFRILQKLVNDSQQENIILIRQKLLATIIYFTNLCNVLCDRCLIWTFQGTSRVLLHGKGLRSRPSPTMSSIVRCDANQLEYTWPQMFLFNTVLNRYFPSDRNNETLNIFLISDGMFSLPSRLFEISEISSSNYPSDNSNPTYQINLLRNESTMSTSASWSFRP